MFLNEGFKFIDLFAGIGGFHIALKSLGGDCVFASEIDRHACDTYEMNHKMRPYGDITMIEPHRIPDHDILTAGFPCQPFSQAGAKLGIEDTRGTLFFNVADILKVKRPKFAILENVRGLISNDGGRTLLTILRTLREVGYTTIVPDELLNNGDINKIKACARSMLLNSKDFGIPQNRVRIYIVAWLSELDGFKYKYPVGAQEPTRVGDILESSIDDSYTISDKLWTGHKNRKAKNQLAGKGFGYSLVSAESPYTNTISARYYKDGSEILIDQNANRNPRKLTPREAARLQGFPDSFQVSKSKTQAYKQFGNSITVVVARSVVEKLLLQK